VGVIGRKRAGKDSFAARLVEAHGFVRYAFADPIKAAVLALDPLVPMPDSVHPWRLSEVVASHGWEDAKDVPEVRRLLQHFGTGLRDTLGANVWRDYALRKVDLEPRPVVITDVRFPNEASAIASRGGVLVRVVRPGLEHSDTHVSETALDDRRVDYTVVNGSTLDDLRGLADAIAGAL
jgi:hypothetical protein